MQPAGILQYGLVDPGFFFFNLTPLPALRSTLVLYIVEGGTNLH